MKWMMLVVGLVLASPAMAQENGLVEYAIDAGHSLAAFDIGFLHTKVRGEFDTWRGTILYDAAKPERTSATVVIETKSIHTGSEHRDEHLRSDDFFDVEKYPLIKFHTREVERRGKDLVLVGPLTMHGVTRDVRIPMAVTQPPTADPHGTTSMNFAGGLRLARKDFRILGGSKHNDWFDALRSATMADTVEITLEVQGWTTHFEGPADERLEQSIARVTAIGADSLARTLRARAAASPQSLQGQEWGIDQLGRALLVRHREAEGLKILQLNADLFPNSPAARTSLARALELSGKKTEALASYDRALELDPDDPRAQEWRRRLAP